MLAHGEDDARSEERGSNEKGLQEFGASGVFGILGGEHDALSQGVASDPLDGSLASLRRGALDDDHRLTVDLEVVASVSGEEVANRANTRESLDRRLVHGDNLTLLFFLSTVLGYSFNPLFLLRFPSRYIQQINQYSAPVNPFLAVFLSGRRLQALCHRDTKSLAEEHGSGHQGFSQLRAGEGVAVLQATTRDVGVFHGPATQDHRTLHSLVVPEGNLRRAATTLVSLTKGHQHGLAVELDVVTDLSRGDRSDAVDASDPLDVLDVAHGALPSVSVAVSLQQ